MLSSQLPFLWLIVLAEVKKKTQVRWLLAQRNSLPALLLIAAEIGVLNTLEISVVCHRTTTPAPRLISVCYKVLYKKNIFQI